MLLPPPLPLVIKTHYVESSAVLLCIPSVHTVLGILDNTANGSECYFHYFDFAPVGLHVATGGKIAMVWIKDFPYYRHLSNIKIFKIMSLTRVSGSLSLKMIFNPFPIYNTSIL